MNFHPSFRRKAADPVPLSRPSLPDGGSCSRLAEALTRLVEDPEFPCVGAKSALAQGNLEVMTAASLAGDGDDSRIQRRLAEWSRAARHVTDGFRSLAVIFEGPRCLDERGFEIKLWERLGALLALDRRRGHHAAAGFSANPSAPDFALSFGGEAYFAVGLHPHASRPARRLPYPTIVFNLHSQFARLRADGRYEKMRKVILSRDEALAGSVNPMVARHGEVSEARQYSGRAVGEGWVCPMAPREEGA